MKFTKLMALALVLVMIVSAFAACGGTTETETDAPETNAPETNAPETNAPETEPGKETEKEPENDCEHPENRRREMDRQNPTCTEGGYVTYLCRICNEQFTVQLDATHTYGEMKSVDGKYTKYSCVNCDDSYVADENGAVVADASAIAFPFFVADFAGKESLADAVAGYSDVKLVKEEFVDVVVNAEDGSAYLNVPTGTSAVAPNGYFTLADVNNKLATKDFSIKFAVKFFEYPTEAISLLTWTLGGTEYDLLTLDATGKISVLGTEQSKVLVDKGWDVIEVCFDVETSDYYVYMNEELFAKGNIGASVAGKTESSLRFFEGASQFEAYVDDMDIKFIDEAKTDACIHVYVETAQTAAACETEGSVTYTCSLCTAQNVVTVPATGHTLGAADVVAATCTVPGSINEICTVCNKTVSTELPALGHTSEWELVDGTPVQSCTVCGYQAIYTTAGDARLFLDFENGTLAEAIEGKMDNKTDNATIVEQDGNKVLDVKHTRLNDSTNYLAFSGETMIFQARMKFGAHSLGATETKESLISFVTGYAGTEKTGEAVGWGIVLAFVYTTDGSTKIAISKTPTDASQWVEVEFDAWYDITIIIADKYYVFVGDTCIGSANRANYADPNYGGGATLRIGENGKSEAFIDDIAIFDIEIAG